MARGRAGHAAAGDRGDRRLRRRPAGRGAGRAGAARPPTRARSTASVPATAGPHRLATLPGLTTTVRVTVLALRRRLPDGARRAARAGHPRAHRATRAAGAGRRRPAAGRRCTRSTAAPSERGACFPARTAPAATSSWPAPARSRSASTGSSPRPVDAAYGLRLTALPRPGARAAAGRAGDGVRRRRADRRRRGRRVRARSTATRPPRGWPSRSTTAPTLRLSWPGQRRLDRMRLVVPAAPAGRATASRCCCARPAGRARRGLGADGWVRFPALTTDRLAIAVTAVAPGARRPARQRLAGAGRVAGARCSMPAGVLTPATGSARARGAVRHRADRDARRRCLPDLGVRHAGRRPGRARPLPVTVCDDFAERVGAAHGRRAPAAHRAVGGVRGGHGGADRADGAGRAGRARRAVTVSPLGRDRSGTVTVGPGAAALLVVPENFNAGLDGDAGRRAAARGPGGRVAAGVRGAGRRGRRGDAEFTPDRPYRAGLAAGAAACCWSCWSRVAGASSPAGAAGRRGCPGRGCRRAGGRLVDRRAAGGCWSVALGGCSAAVALPAAGRDDRAPAAAGRAARHRLGVAGIGHGDRGRSGGCRVTGRSGPTARRCRRPCWRRSARSRRPSRPRPAARPIRCRPRRHPPAGLRRPLPGHLAPVRAACSGRSCTSRPIRTGSTRCWPPTRCASSAPMWTWTAPGCSTSAAGPATSPTRVPARPARRTSGLDPAVGDFAAGRRRGRAGMVRGSGTALPVRSGAVDVCYSSNVLEHVADARGDARRDGAGDPAGRHGLRVVHAVAVAVGRARDGAVALPRRRHVPGGGTCGASAASRRTASGRRCSRSARRGRCAGRGPPQAGAPTIVDVLPRYHPWWARWVARVPLLRETLTWNFTLVLRRPDKSFGGRLLGCDSVVTCSPAGASACRASIPTLWRHS